MILQLAELFFVERRQRGRRNIEAQMHRRRDFIDVLPAGALRPHRMDVDFRIRNCYGARCAASENKEDRFISSILNPDLSSRK